MTIDQFRLLLEETVSIDDLTADLRPPKHFSQSRFTNYLPDPRYTSQQHTVDRLSRFIQERFSSSFLTRFLRSASSGVQGIYLDGGFGVGKTHLLAATYHAHSAPSEAKAFLSFQELMFLVGLQTLGGVVETFKDHQLLVIDEFELDDPANTRISTNLLRQLFDAGVRIVTSSNTPPGALGEGKFSLDSFRRELGEITTRFESLRIDGEDYRTVHGALQTGHSTWAPDLAPSASDTECLRAPFGELLETLARAHPIRVRNALRSLEAIELVGVHEIADPHAALRFVYLIDKVYDDEIELSASSELPIDKLFSPAIFHGGDTKKYLRTISRLTELTSR